MAGYKGTCYRDRRWNKILSWWSCHWSVCLALKEPELFGRLIGIDGDLCGVGKKCWYFGLTKEQEWQERDITKMASRVTELLFPKASFPLELKMVLEKVPNDKVPTALEWLRVPVSLPDKLSSWKENSNTIIKHLGTQLSERGVTDEQFQKLSTISLDDGTGDSPPVRGPLAELMPGRTRLDDLDLHYLVIRIIPLFNDIINLMPVLPDLRMQTIKRKFAVEPMEATIDLVDTIKSLRCEEQFLRALERVGITNLK
eukprot:TRINITY_DN8325_c0_g1_i1.p1 TRINITY_DN8325_c0_g1~~TRINITY_DN8325_c0_g1_i1.p1  ORF type:complete len:256 (-),score=36.52 TRINITY_DN8325_c0_g1_i1:105-872(-)